MNAVALIGARSGSKGVPHKNIRDLAGHPLLAWSIKAAHKAGLPAVVSTDSRQYAEIAHSYDATVILRPEELSQDHSTDLEFVRHAMATMVPGIDYIVHLRPTTPFRDPAYITKALASMQEHPEATALRSVHEMPESAWKTCEIEKSTGMLLPLMVRPDEALDFINDPRQVFSATHHPNGYVDILRTDFIRESGLMHGNKVLAFITPPVVEVDSEADFELLEWQSFRHPELVHRVFG